MVAAWVDPVNAPTIGIGKVTMASKRRLHVWEHHSLHPSKGTANPVHVIYDDHEFDYWLRDDFGNIHLGWHYQDRYEDPVSIKVMTEKGLPLDYLRKEDHTIIAGGMYAKAWLEEYDDEPTPLYDQNDKAQEQTREFTPEEAREALRQKFDDAETDNTVAGTDPEFVSPRQRFETQQPLDVDLADPELGVTKLIMPLKREPIVDKATGVNLTDIANQVHGGTSVTVGLVLDPPKEIEDKTKADTEKEDSLLGLKASDVA